jgi:hypothetical protein
MALPDATRSRSLVALLLLAGVPMLTAGQTLRPARPAIRLEQVVAALDRANLPLANAEVNLLAQNTASTDKPRLEVRGVEAWGDRGARVRMDCEAHEQCLPFYVAVHWADAGAAQAALQSASGLPGTRVATKGQQFGEGVARVAEKSSAQKDLGAPGLSVHVGSRATLLLDGGKLHIQLPVICLEDGEPGRTIRVTALDHKQTYRAEVVDSTLLKATL